MSAPLCDASGQPYPEFVQRLAAAIAAGERLEFGYVWRARRRAWVFRYELLSRSFGADAEAMPVVLVGPPQAVHELRD